jgi:Chlorophyll A-B binding protein
MDRLIRVKTLLAAQTRKQALLSLVNLFLTPTRFGAAIMTTSTKEIASNNKDRNDWQWGFTPQAELWNGRFAMLGFIAALLTEWLSGDGILHFYNLMHYTSVAIR